MGQPPPAVLAVALPVRDRVDGRAPPFTPTRRVLRRVVLLAAIAYFGLQTVVVREQGPDWPLGAALGRDMKGKLSPSSTRRRRSRVRQPWIALALYVFVALMWFVPDRRLEHMGVTPQA